MDAEPRLKLKMIQPLIQEVDTTTMNQSYELISNAVTQPLSPESKAADSSLTESLYESVLESSKADDSIASYIQVIDSKTANIEEDSEVYSNDTVSTSSGIQYADDSFSTQQTNDNSLLGQYIAIQDDNMQHMNDMKHDDTMKKDIFVDVFDSELDEQNHRHQEAIKPTDAAVSAQNQLESPLKSTKDDMIDSSIDQDLSKSMQNGAYDNTSNSEPASPVALHPTDVGNISFSDFKHVDDPKTLESIRFLVDLNKKSQEQATVAIQRAEAIHGLFIETVERLEELEGVKGLALPSSRNLMIDIDNIAIRDKLGVGFEDDGAMSSPTNDSLLSRQFSDDTAVITATVDAVDGILQGFRYHTMVLHSQSISTIQLLASGSLVPYNKAELLEKRYQDYMQPADQLHDTAVEDIADSIVTLFNNFKQMLQSSKHLSTLSIGELRYALKSMHLLDGKMTNNNDIDIMMKYLNTRKITIRVFAFILVICVTRTFRKNVSSIEVIERLSDILTSNRIVTPKRPYSLWTSIDSPVLTEENHLSPLENKYSTQIFAAPTSSQKSIPQDVLELVQSESAALYDIFEAYLPKVPRVSKPTETRTIKRASQKNLSIDDMNNQRSPKAAKAERQTVVGLRFDGYLQFAKDFEIYPQLADKAELKGFWNNASIFSSLTSNGHKDLVDKNHEPMLTFSQFQILISMIGVKCALLADSSNTTSYDKVRNRDAHLYIRL